jgi:hypothetical protein
MKRNNLDEQIKKAIENRDEETMMHITVEQYKEYCERNGKEFDVMDMLLFEE